MPENTNKKVAFVLLRHGQDFRKKKGVKEPSLWEYSCKEHNEDGAAICSKKDRWNYYFEDPKAAKVQIRVRRLNEDGRRQSYELKAALPRWLDENGYAPISRVETKDPRQPNGNEGRTQNPFQTVYPMVKELEKDNKELSYIRLKFMVGTPPDDELTYDALKDNRGDYSTVLCWDCQGLWGEKVDGKWPSKAADGSILKRLVDDQVSTWPLKCDDIYILTYNSTTSKFTVEHHLNLPKLVDHYNIDIDKKLYVDGKDSTE